MAENEAQDHLERDAIAGVGQLDRAHGQRVFGMTDTSGNSDLMIAALMRSSASVSAQRAILAAFAAGADGMSLET